MDEDDDASKKKEDAERIPGVVPKPHEGQERLLNLKARFRIAVCGRRFGKTFAAAIATVRHCENKCNQRVWWISPIQQQSDWVEREIAFWVLKPRKPKPDQPKEKKRKVAQKKTLPEWTHRKIEHALVNSNGSRIEFHSAHVPDNLRGAGLDLVVVDEAADVDEYAWKMVIKPMLLDSKGQAFIIGTPRGTNHWLHRVYLMGNDPERAERFNSLQLPTRANPKIDKKEIEDYREEMTPEEYEQEIEAKFIDGVNALFASIDPMRKTPLLDAGRPGRIYVTGIDLGRKVDYTVLCSICLSDKRVEGFARFNLFDWNDQLVRIEDHLKRFPGPCVVDSTGIGDALFENIRAFRGEKEAFLFTASSKHEIIHRLSIDLGRKVFPCDHPAMLLELKAFTTLSDKQGNSRARYGSPHGLHDDCVMALALAWWGVCTHKEPEAPPLPPPPLHSGNPFRDGLFNDSNGANRTYGPHENDVRGFLV